MRYVVGILKPLRLGRTALGVIQLLKDRRQSRSDQRITLAFRNRHPSLEDDDDTRIVVLGNLFLTSTH